jgi:uncharacterized protein
MRSLFLATLLLMTACASVNGESHVTLKGKRFNVEVAANQEARARGLMFRDELAADRGMLFIHVVEEPQAYWMRNTKIPLDIFYFDSQRKLVSVQKNVPACSADTRCPPYPSEGAALYVLELNAGLADQLGVQRGDVVEFSEDIQKISAEP